MEITTKVTLRRIRPHKNERRFYRLQVVSDLFGTFLLARNWGRIGTDGQRRFDVYSDAEVALVALRRLAAIKHQRGYIEMPPNF